MNKIAKIGVEIEGGFRGSVGDNNCDCSECRIAPEYFRRDVSVRTNSNFNGEVVSPAFSDIGDCLAWMDRNYPSEFNETCGIHVHLSFNNLQSYVKLMNKQFHRGMVNNFAEWGQIRDIYSKSQFWTRLGGYNRFCRKRHTPESQIYLTEKDPIRYTHLNYCFKMHGTIELRLLPTFKSKELALDTVARYYNFVNRYLAKCRMRNYKFSEEVLCV